MHLAGVLGSGVSGVKSGKAYWELELGLSQSGYTSE